FGGPEDAHAEPEADVARGWGESARERGRRDRTTGRDTRSRYSFHGLRKGHGTRGTSPVSGALRAVRELDRHFPARGVRLSDLFGKPPGGNRGVRLAWVDGCAHAGRTGQHRRGGTVHGVRGPVRGGRCRCDRRYMVPLSDRSREEA